MDTNAYAFVPTAAFFVWILCTVHTGPTSTDFSSFFFKTGLTALFTCYYIIFSFYQQTGIQTYREIIKFLPLFCLSIARIRSKSRKSDNLIGLDIDVISIPRLFEAALILGSASFPFYNNKKTIFVNTITVPIFPCFLSNQINNGA